MTVRVLGQTLPAARTYTVLLSIALFLLLVTVGATFWQADRQHTADTLVERSLSIPASTRQFVMALRDAESGQRGYLLTGNASYVESFATARATASARLDDLDIFAADDAQLADEVARLRELSKRKFDEMENTTALYAAGRSNEALLIVHTDRGKELTDEALAIANRIIDREVAQLRRALAAVERGSLFLRGLVVVAALLLVGVGVLLVLAVRNALDTLRTSRDAAETARANLAAEIDTRIAAEAKVVQMQKMEAIGQLTGGVAHDFNNMLAVIISSLGLLQRRLDRGDHDVGRFVEAAQDAARRASSLTSRLLAFARRSALTPAVINPNQLVSGMSELLRRTLGEQVQMETVLAGGLWNVHVDVSQLENAIVNICVNARDAMPDGGKLTIETANTFLDDAYASATPDVTPGQYAMIAITDTGGGMSPEVAARAFEPFFTTKEVGKGTGLGLSHVHGFLKQSGGHVAIYTEQGVGTTLKLYLPRSTQEAEEVRPGVENLPPPPGDPGVVVMVVEDEERVRVASVASLRELGYTVLHAESGAKALEKLSSGVVIQLLFTDIVMPDMSGRMLADKVRELYPEVKVLFTTGYTQNAIVHNGVVDADARLLQKPYSLNQLAHKVRAVLDEKL